MHVILRTSLVLVSMVSVVAAHLIAERTEELFPLSAPAQIHITSGPGGQNEPAAVVADFEGNDLAAALVTFDATPDGVRRLVVLSPGFTGQPGAPDALTPGGHGDDFGTRLASTQIRVLEAGVDTVYGQWTVFGSDGDIERSADDLRRDGFTAEVVWNDAAATAAQAVTVVPPLLVLAVAAFLFATSAAAWSLTADSRRARRVHGLSRCVVSGGDLAKTATFVVALWATTWLGWLATATLAWGSRQTIGPTGLLVAQITALSGGTMIAITTLAALVTHGGSRPAMRPRDRRARTILGVAAGAALLAIGASMLTATEALAEADAGLLAATAKHDSWRDRSARIISLRATEQSVVDREAPGWSRFVASEEATGHLLLDYLEPGCLGLSLPVDCVVVTSTYLQQAASQATSGVDEFLDDTDDRVRVFVPLGLAPEARALESSVKDLVAFQREVETRFTCPDADCFAGVPVAAVTVQTYRSPLELPLLTAYPRTDTGEDVLVDPVVVVIPSGRRVLSVDYHLAAMSTGDELYIGSHDELDRALEEHGIRDLVFAHTEVRDETGSLVPQWRAWKDQSLLTLWLCSLLAAAMVLLLVWASVRSRARSLSVQRIHGLGPFRRHGRMMILIAALGAAGPFASLLSTQQMTTPEIVMARAITAGLALAAAFVLLAWPTALWCEGRSRGTASSTGRRAGRRPTEGDNHGAS
ncbi:hypothetical protein [Frigoribacterium sp. VKM Ac-2836]|uniref:hypothetical protein n=1 Tax=Frigoribacterium sp. VKM Ac-2836 TaxID=2739014 RepID=UPI001C263D39|nr:hypothetical protein [Frigoribacterium sp. VKM Ac-2836]NRD26559.1 hypothetical protein [Frigoribacterium sp. VKM Ac-2836]